MINVEVANEQSTIDVDPATLQQAVRAVLQGESIAAANVSVAVVDDDAIHVLNRKYLQHDYATDVLSFLLSSDDAEIDGEVIVSADTALREAARFAWQAEDELLLYLIHGTLHLVGYDDATDDERGVMRAKEAHYLAVLGRATPGEARSERNEVPASTHHPAEGESKP